MNYEQAYEFIINYPRFAKVNTLSRMERILGKLGNPHKKLRFVHIAGTNGKGSVSAMTASILRRAGYRTGLFISPFVEDFRERISIDGELISKEDFAGILTDVREYGESCDTMPNAFELISAVAFKYYAEKNCDIVVLETGLGGRWDATNVIPAPYAAVITSISYDHTNILGDTISKIAAEKAGILKTGSYAVTCGGQEPEALEVIKNTCAEKQIPLIVSDEKSVRIFKETIEYTDICYKGMSIRIPFAGRHQVQNALVAVEAAFAVKKKGFTITEDNIIKGIFETRFPVRTEVVCKSPLIIIDGAHNTGGIKALCGTIERLLIGYEIISVFGCLKDKLNEEAIKLIAGASDIMYIAMPDSTRAADIGETEKVAGKYCDRVKSCKSLKDAVTDAKNRASDNSAVIICGSLYLAGEARGIVRELCP